MKYEEIINRKIEKITDTIRTYAELRCIKSYVLNFIYYWNIEEKAAEYIRNEFNVEFKCEDIGPYVAYYISNVEELKEFILYLYNEYEKDIIEFIIKEMYEWNYMGYIGYDIIEPEEKENM